MSVRQSSWARIDLIRVFRDVLAKEHGKRTVRSSDFVRFPGDEVGQEWPMWLVLEIQAAHEEVTRRRAMLGEGPVSIARVREVELRAAGHADYELQFACRLADLVLTERQGGLDASETGQP